jgi:hypothetical protein
MLVLPYEKVDSAHTSIYIIREISAKSCRFAGIVQLDYFVASKKVCWGDARCK